MDQSAECDPEAETGSAFNAPLPDGPFAKYWRENRLLNSSLISLLTMTTLLLAYFISIGGSLLSLTLFVSTSNFWFAVGCAVLLSTSQVGVNVAGQVTGELDSDARLNAAGGRPSSVDFQHVFDRRSGGVQG